MSRPRRRLFGYGSRFHCWSIARRMARRARAEDARHTRGETR